MAEHTQPDPAGGLAIVVIPHVPLPEPPVPDGDDDEPNCQTLWQM